MTIDATTLLIAVISSGLFTTIVTQIFSAVNLRATGKRDDMKILIEAMQAQIAMMEKQILRFDASEKELRDSFASVQEENLNLKRKVNWLEFILAKNAIAIPPIPAEWNPDPKKEV